MWGMNHPKTQTDCVSPNPHGDYLRACRVFTLRGIELVRARSEGRLAGEDALSPTPILAGVGSVEKVNSEQ